MTLLILGLYAAEIITIILIICWPGIRNKPDLE